MLGLINGKYVEVEEENTPFEEVFEPPTTEERLDLLESAFNEFVEVVYNG